MKKLVNSKRKLSQIMQNSFLVGSIALTMASAALAQSSSTSSSTSASTSTTSPGSSNSDEQGEMPPPPPGHGHGPGGHGPDLFVLLCAGQKLAGVTLPIPPTKPTDAIRTQVDAAIQACAAELPTQSSNSKPSTSD